MRLAYCLAGLSLRLFIGVADQDAGGGLELFLVLTLLLAIPGALSSSAYGLWRDQLHPT